MLLRQTPELGDLLRGILRNSAATEETGNDSDFEDESDEEDNIEEENEVINLSRTALASLKKLPTLEELEKSATDGKKEQEGDSDTVVEELSIRAQRE
jgi:hypothetical protein